MVTGISHGPGISDGPGISEYEPTVAEIPVIDEKKEQASEPDDPFLGFGNYIDWLHEPETKEERKSTYKSSPVFTREKESGINFPHISTLIALMVVVMITMSIWNSLFQTSPLNTNSTLLTVQNTFMPLLIVVTVVGVFISVIINVIGRSLFSILTFFPLSLGNES